MGSSTQYNKVRNERRKAQRRIASLSKKLGETKNSRTKTRIRKQIKDLKRGVELSRIYDTKTGKKIRSQKQVAKNLNKLIERNERTEQYVHGQKRINKAMQTEINRASVGKSSIYKQSEVHIFYRATQNAWINELNPKMRNEAILKYYGKENLQDFFEEVINNDRNKKVQKAMEIINNPNGDYTDEERQEAFVALFDNDDDFQISPDSRERATEIAEKYSKNNPIEAPMFPNE